MLKNTIPAALREHGPLTNAGLMLLIEGATTSGIRRSMDALRIKRKAYIAGHARAAVGTPGPPCPIYALGDLPDVPRPDTKRIRQDAKPPPKIKPVKAVKVVKPKPAPKDIGLPRKVRPLVAPKAHEPMRINRVHDLGMWGGLMA